MLHLITLLLLALGGGQARAQAPGITADDISYCLGAWVEYYGGDYDATFFCPTDVALDKFAVMSGFDSFQDLWALWSMGGSARSAKLPRRARPHTPHKGRRLLDNSDPPLFVQRFFKYMTIDGYPALRAAELSAGSVDTALDGASFNLDSVPVPGKPNAWTITPTTATLGQGIAGKFRIVPDLVIRFDGSDTKPYIVVHAIDLNFYFLPPFTFHTLDEAFSKNPGLTTTRKYYSTNLRYLTKQAGKTEGTLFAPLNNAWAALLLTKPLPLWLMPWGTKKPSPVDVTKLTTKNQQTKALLSAILRYHLIPDVLTASDIADMLGTTDPSYEDTSLLVGYNSGKGKGKGLTTKAVATQWILLTKNATDTKVIGGRALGYPDSPDTTGASALAASVLRPAPSGNDVWGAGVVVQPIDIWPLFPWLTGVAAFDGNRTPISYS